MEAILFALDIAAMVYLVLWSVRREAASKQGVRREELSR